MNRISLLDCLSSLSHVSKLKSLSASSSPIVMTSKREERGNKMEREMCPVVEKEVVRAHLGHHGYISDKQWAVIIII